MKENNYIYLDNAATTLVNDEVVALYVDIETKHFANANSLHALGLDAARYYSKAKETILDVFNLKDYNVIFTSSASEANNLAIKGLANQYKKRGKHIITSKIEHPSVLNAFKQLEESYGFKVTYLNVDQYGLVDLKELEEAMDDETILVSIMAVNNEVGVIEPIKEIAKIVHKYPKAFFHVDMTQAIGKVNLDLSDIDLFSFSGHKIHGPKGCGALVYKSKIAFEPLINGGSQEYGYRGGTSNVAGACALAKALKYSLNNVNEKIEHAKLLKERLISSLKEEDIEFNSSEHSSPFIVNFSLKNKKASVVVEALSNKNIYVSSVSACSSKKEPISYVITEMKHDELLAKNSIRVSFSEDTSLEEVDKFIDTFKEILRSIR